MARQVNIAEAKAKLSELVEAASRGEEIVLARHGKPVARLSAMTPNKAPGRRKFGQNEAMARHLDWDRWWRDWKAMDAETEADADASDIFPKADQRSRAFKKRAPSAKASSRGRKQR